MMSGKITVSVLNNQEEKSKVLPEEAKCILELKFNLISILVALNKGAKLTSEGTSLILEKGGKRLSFDHKILVGSSFLMVARVQRDCDERLIISKIKEMKLEKFHRLLGHTSIYTRQATAKKLEMKIIGNFKHCEDCILGKIKKKIEEIQSLQVKIAW
jgi:hypothetical protein